jgi:hypothetical protein
MCVVSAVVTLDILKQCMFFDSRNNHISVTTLERLCRPRGRNCGAHGFGGGRTLSSLPSVAVILALSCRLCVSHYTHQHALLSTFSAIGQAKG